MNVILLSGGSGKRLWPLSNDIRSKQFIKIFKTDSGYESMVQRIYGQIKKAVPDCSVTIATSKQQVSSIHNQLGDNVWISVEPYRRDTFPAIALAAAYLKDIKGIDENETAVVCPVDPYVNDDYFAMLKKLDRQAEKGEANLVLMGIEPTYPSEKYGYIIPESSDDISRVTAFREKPDAETAEKYISEGALWNGGVFAFKIKYLLGIAERLLGTRSYSELYLNYEKLEKISFDYAVAEKETAIQMMRFNGKWSDIGSWSTLSEAMSRNIIGDAAMDETCENLHIINELDVPILAIGIKDAVISASPDGILVSDKERSGLLKKYVEASDRKVMFAEKSWGSFRVIDAESDSLTIKVTIKPGDSMNYHSHERRDEVWVVVSGIGKAVVDGTEMTVTTGDIITMKAGSRHTVIAETELKMIEVQIGKEITVEDKQKYPFGT